MTDIAHIIQVELDRLNHSVEPFANYGRHVAAVLSRLRELENAAQAPPLEEIKGLIERLDVIADGADIREDQQAELHKAAAALRSQAQELERTKDDLRRVQSVYDFANLSAERDSLAQEVEKLRNQSALDRTISGASLKRIRELEAEVERLKTERINAEMAHGALHAIHDLLDDWGIPRGTFADDHVRNLVAMYNQRGLRIRELEAELGSLKAKTIEECKKAIVNVRFGAPSNWGGDRPRGWHLDRPCTPEEASHHDNGCNDAFMAVSALADAADRASKI